MTLRPAFVALMGLAANGCVLFGLSARQPYTSFDPRGEWSVPAATGVPAVVVRVEGTLHSPQFFTFDSSQGKGTAQGLADGKTLYAVWGARPATLYLVTQDPSDIGQVIAASVEHGLAEQTLVAKDSGNDVHTPGIVAGGYYVEGADYGGHGISGSMLLMPLDGMGNDDPHPTANLGNLRYERMAGGRSTVGAGLWNDKMLFLAETHATDDVSTVPITIGIGRWNGSVLDWTLLPVTVAADGRQQVAAAQHESWIRLSGPPRPARPVAK